MYFCIVSKPGIGHNSIKQSCTIFNGTYNAFRVIGSMKKGHLMLTSYRSEIMENERTDGIALLFKLHTFKVSWDNNALGVIMKGSNTRTRRKPIRMDLRVQEEK